MDMECILEYAKEKEETRECQDESYITKTILMNTTIHTNLSSTSNQAPLMTTPSRPTPSKPTILMGVTTKIPNLIPYVTKPSRTTPSKPTILTGATSKTPNLTLHVTEPSRPTPSKPTISTGATSKTPHLTPHVTEPTTSTGATSKTPHLTPHVTEPTTSTGATSKTPNSTPHVTEPSRPTPSKPTKSTGATSKTPHLTQHVTEPSISTGATSKTPNLTLHVTEPSRPTPSKPTKSTGANSKTTNLTPHVTEPSGLTSSQPIISTGATSKTPNLSAHLTTPSTATGTTKPNLVTSSPAENELPSENDHSLQSYLIYKIMRPNGTYESFKLYNTYKIFRPNISGMLWFPAGLIRWSKYQNFYAPLRNMVFNFYNLYYDYYRNFISNYFGNRFPSEYSIYKWKPADLNAILNYYKQTICSRLQYHSIQPEKTSSVQSWLGQYFPPGNQQPEWFQQLLQQCLKETNTEKLQILELYKPYPSNKGQLSSSSTALLQKLMSDIYNPWKKYLALAQMYRYQFPSAVRNYPQVSQTGYLASPNQQSYINKVPVVYNPRIRNSEYQKNLAKMDESNIQDENSQQLIASISNNPVSLEDLRKFFKCVCEQSN